MGFVSKPTSQTAYYVAYIVGHYDLLPGPLSAQMGRLIPNGISHLTAQLLAVLFPPSRLHRTLSYLKRVRSLLIRLALWLFPMIGVTAISLATRKRHMHDMVVKAIGEGATQVVIYGAGYDVLATTLAQSFPNVLFVEVDHPNISPIKAGGVEALGQRKPNLMFVAADLSTGRAHEKILQATGWDRKAKSVAVAEGLFMYLTKDAVQACAAGFRQMTRSGSTMLFMYMLEEHWQRVHFMAGWIVYWVLQWFQEPLLWVPKSQEEVEQLMSRAGLLTNAPLSETKLVRSLVKGQEIVPNLDQTVALPLQFGLAVSE